MMHPHFYHWHNRTELKPETTLLQPRWEAAATLAEQLSADRACGLLRLALFGTAATEFARGLSEEVVRQEPTFPPDGNAELLRVMATAALYSQMETESNEAAAVALGLLAAAFQPNRIQPVCKELMQRATEYTATESERLRPTPKVEGEYRALTKAFNSNDWAANPDATTLLGNAVLELGETLGRISEENQFLWWLLGRRSSLLNRQRDKLAAKEYALVAAAEAAERVALLPPPASVESLIGEVLTQCSKGATSVVSLVDLITAANIDSMRTTTVAAVARDLCPLASLVETRVTGDPVDGASLEKLSISAKLKVSPMDAANQYFRELMFLRALTQLG
jgi:GTPase-associated system helical domain